MMHRVKSSHIEPVPWWEKQIVRKKNTLHNNFLQCCQSMSTTTWWMVQDRNKSRPIKQCLIHFFYRWFIFSSIHQIDQLTPPVTRNAVIWLFCFVFCHLCVHTDSAVLFKPTASSISRYEYLNTAVCYKLQKVFPLMFTFAEMHNLFTLHSFVHVRAGKSC